MFIRSGDVLCRANRRVTIPEAFLTTDIILTTLQNVSTIADSIRAVAEVC